MGINLNTQYYPSGTFYLVLFLTFPGLAFLFKDFRCCCCFINKSNFSAPLSSLRLLAFVVVAVAPWNLRLLLSLLDSDSFGAVLLFVLRSLFAVAAAAYMLVIMLFMPFDESPFIAMANAWSSMSLLVWSSSPQSLGSSRVALMLQREIYLFVRCEKGT